MLNIKFLGLFALLSILANTQGAQKKWWETASFYQIYPRSFKDSNGDGIGDLNGITEQLPYLKEIGIAATWLSPIFTSPMADFGYDISNFTEIDPIFGTMKDFEALIARAKAVGVKIIVDFVPNHSSDECEWFIKSANGDQQYKDYYVWHRGKVVNGKRQPPNNWISNFRGSAWSWNEKRQAYYLHQFHRKQPDFNFRNPAVRAMMMDVLRFWVRKGVSGFRVDAINYAYEFGPDANGNWPDEPRNQYNNDPADYNYLQHIYTTDQPATFDLVYEFRKVMDEMQVEMGGDELILMTEAYSPLDKVMLFYGNGTVNGAQMPFNFELIKKLDKNSDAYRYDEIINGWLSHMPEGRTANWVLGNHDQNRVGSRMGEDRMDLLNMLLFTLPGCSVTYQGEEIGMTDVWLTWEETIDPAGCQSNPQEYERFSRDPVRTPFQWNEGKFAGFTAGTKTWLPVSSNHKIINVKRERGIAMSHLNVYKQLHNLRQEITMREGDAEVKALSSNVLAIKRFLSGHTTYIVLFNIMDDIEVINLHAAFSGVSKEVEYVVVTDKSPKRKGDRAFADTILLVPKEAVVLRTL